MKNYPDQYEISTTTKAGLNIRIRPIRADDATLLLALFHTLSSRSIYFRFFAPVTAPSEETLEKLAQVDHDRHVVLVATQKADGRESILGVFRLMCDPDVKQGELAIVVGDPWQGRGVGARLFQHGLSIAKERGIESIFGTVLAENVTVLTLVRRLGFTVKWDSDAAAYDVRLNLKTTALRDMEHA